MTTADLDKGFPAWLTVGSSMPLPVILLGKAGVVHLLPSLCDELVIPAEGRGRGATGASRRRRTRMARRGRGKICSPCTTASFGARTVEWRSRRGRSHLVGPGPSRISGRTRRPRGPEASHAPRRSHTWIATRNRHGKGTRIDSTARPALEKLRGAGAYVSDDLIERAIALAGEA